MRWTLWTAFAVLAGLTASPARAAGAGERGLDALLGAERGLCVGTQAECRKGVAAPPAEFDLAVAFKLDSAILTPEARRSLLAFAAALKDERLSAAVFVVEGHTDASGGEAYNEQLSVARARAVVDFLVAQGVASEKLRISGLGESEPRMADPYDAANRRVEMKIRIR